MTSKKNYTSYKSIFFLFLFYLVISEVSQTVLYTIVTYIVTAAGKSGMDFSNTVNEIAGQYLFLTFAIASAIVAGTTHLADKALYRHQPFWNDPHKPLWNLDRLTKAELMRGIASGAIAVAVFLLVFTLSHQIGFLGVYLTSTLGTPVFPLFFIDLASLLVLVTCDEYIFRHKILRSLSDRLSPLPSSLLTIGAYLLIKHSQFILQPLDYASLTLLNLTVIYFFFKNHKCHRGLGFLCALFTCLHSFSGLPLWGYESPSFFLFKTTQRTSSLLSGGESGPLAGLGLFSILCAFTAGSYYSWKHGVKNKNKN